VLMLSYRRGGIAIVNLSNSFGDCGTFESLKGIAYKKEEKISKPPCKTLYLTWTRFHCCMETVFYGSYTEASTGSNFFRKNGMVSSRGCLYNCIYCYHLFGRSNIILTALNMIKEIEELIYKYNFKYRGFVDDNFLVNKKKVYEFCDLLKKEKISIKMEYYRQG
jgi:radical SAM superfamily enzyme YgiQ (UPF0313 family)